MAPAMVALMNVKSVTINPTCATPGCSGKPKPSRKCCESCRTKARRAKYPVKFHYERLKWKAKQRGIAFGLTFAEWEVFCAETGYVTQVGQSADAMTVDRIDARRGYLADNIRMVTRAENTVLGNQFRLNKLPDIVVRPGGSSFYEEDVTLVPAGDIPDDNPF